MQINATILSSKKRVYHNLLHNYIYLLLFFHYEIFLKKNNGRLASKERKKERLNLLMGLRKLCIPLDEAQISYTITCCTTMED